MPKKACFGCMMRRALTVKSATGVAVSVGWTHRLYPCYNWPYSEISSRYGDVLLRLEEVL